METKQMDKLLKAVKENTFSEGSVGNCRWIYYGTEEADTYGVLALATKSNFDRWANSRIVEIHTTLWDTGDPEFAKFIAGLIKLFDIR